MSWLEKFIELLTKIQAFLAGLALASMIVLTCANIIARAVWVPVRGTFELMGLMGAVAATFALGYTQVHRMHIAVDLVVDRMRDRTRRWLTLTNGLICAIFFGLATWQIIKWSGVLVEVGELTETLQIPYYPFTYATAFGCALLSLIFLLSVLRILFPEKAEDQQ